MTPFMCINNTLRTHWPWHPSCALTTHRGHTDRDTLHVHLVVDILHDLAGTRRPSHDPRVQWRHVVPVERRQVQHVNEHGGHSVQGSASTTKTLRHCSVIGFLNILVFVMPVLILIQFTPWLLWQKMFHLIILAAYYVNRIFHSTCGPSFITHLSWIWGFDYTKHTS